MGARSESALLEVERPAERTPGAVMSIRGRVRRSRLRDASTPLLDYRPDWLTAPAPDPATTPLPELQRFWYAQLRAHGFVDHEREDGRLHDGAPRQVVRGEYRAEDLAEHAAWHTAMCRARDGYPFATPDEREVVRQTLIGVSQRVIALELGRRKAWVGSVVDRCLRWGLREGDDDGE